MTGVFHRLRQWFDQEPGRLRATDKRPQPRWMVLESVASPALGSVYAQVLQRAGIPVLTKQWGAGAGAMGGALTGIRLLVPEDRLDEARAVLDVGRAGSEAENE